MFNQEIWRFQISDRLNTFVYNPRQDMRLSGAVTVLTYLSVRTLEPFLAAFVREPVAAVVTLASMTNGSGADRIVRRAMPLRYQAALILERELRTTAELCVTLEKLIIKLDVVHLVRQRLNSSCDEWLRSTLLKELDTYTIYEFQRLRRLLQDPSLQERYDSIHSLRQQNGDYTSADVALLWDGLQDSAAHIRAISARMLGHSMTTPPPHVLDTLVQIALQDCDLETRCAAARTLGTLRDRVASPQLIDRLGNHLIDADNFVRSSAAFVLGQFGELAGTPRIIANLTNLILDSDSYVREAATRTLGNIGLPASIPAVIDALTRAVEDSDPNVHEAAIDALTRLRKLRGTKPLTPLRHSVEPLVL